MSLGVSEGAVRMRVKRGTLPSTREGERIYVLLDTEHTTDQARSDAEALTSEMRGRIEDLKEQLALEREAHAEARRLLAAALERIPAVEPPESPETPSEPVPGTSAPPEAETPTEIRPWWRRVFGG